MKFSQIGLLLLIGLFVFEEPAACDYSATKEISFRSTNSQDVLHVSWQSDNSDCKGATLSIAILSDDDSLIYENIIPYTPHLYDYGESNYSEKVDEYFDFLLKHSIGTTSDLPVRLSCEAGLDCEYDFFPTAVISYYSDLTIERYNELKSKGVPMITHDVGREAWASFVYDQNTKKAVRIFLRVV